MLPEQKISQLVKFIDTAFDSEVNSVKTQNATAKLIDHAHVKPIVDYILEPYGNGYWELKATWNNASPYAIYLLESLEIFSNLENKIEVSPSTSLSVIVDNLTDDEREVVLRVTNRLTSLHRLFLMIAKVSSGEKIPTPPKFDSWTEQINLDELKIKFIDAWRIFEEKIYFDGFTGGVNASRILIIKTGIVSLLNTPRESGMLLICSAQQENVCIVRDFYMALGVIKDASICRIFAPDEELFKPYFSLVLNVLPHIINHDEQTSTVFSQALSYYEDEDFQHCITTLGLIAENYLQRIYTSLMREQISGGLTLGQTIDKIHKGIDEFFPSSKTTQRTLDSAYQKINSIDPSATIESIKPLLRELVAMIGEDRQHYGQRFDKIYKPSTKRTPFPNQINDNLNELLKWRNAASHNSRIPLGKHEADRTLYCLISLVSWWQKQITTVDWTKSKLEVIETLLSKATATSAK